MRGNGERVLTCGGLITNTGMYVYVYIYVCMDVCGIESIRQNGMLTRGGAPLSETRPEAACAYSKRGGLSSRRTREWLGSWVTSLSFRKSLERRGLI